MSVPSFSKKFRYVARNDVPRFVESPRSGYAILTRIQKNSNHYSQLYVKFSCVTFVYSVSDCCVISLDLVYSMAGSARALSSSVHAPKYSDVIVFHVF